MQLIKYTDLVELLLLLLVFILIIFFSISFIFYKLQKKEIFKLQVEYLYNYNNLNIKIDSINNKEIDKLIKQIYQEVSKKDLFYQIIKNQQDLKIYFDEKNLEILEDLKIEINEQNKQEIEIYKLLNIINRKLYKNKIV